MALLSDQVLRRLIITGRSDLKMPDYAQKDCRTDDFHPLTSDEINDLVAYLRSLEKQPPAVASARVGSQSVETTRSDRTP